jgi:hypothetical protein
MFHVLEIRHTLHKQNFLLRKSLFRSIRVNFYLSNLICPKLRNKIRVLILPNLIHNVNTRHLTFNRTVNLHSIECLGYVRFVHISLRSSLNKSKYSISVSLRIKAYDKSYIDIYNTFCSLVLMEFLFLNSNTVMVVGRRVADFQLSR